MSSVRAAALKPGGAFLLGPTSADELFTPEDFTQEHQAIARTSDDFWTREVVPQLETLQQQAPGVARTLLQRSGELGLLSVTVPEKFGGMELDLTSAMIVAESIGKDGSYAAWHGAHAGIGTLPILLFGTEQQKAKYLPKLASAEWIGAYCLSEPQAGSDALAAKTRAELSADGTHYVLNGQKMWITNGAEADLFTVFAKIGGEKFTAFLVERRFGGVVSGAEERKMGIKGSSTTALYLDNVRVPVENVLGEIGRGHIIAFNILNLGRLKLGPFAVGAAKNVLTESLRYAKQRIAFGKPIASFGIIQHKLAEMAVRIFAAETMSYGVAGMIERRLDGFTWERPEAARQHLAAAEEYAIECSLVKVFASEMLDFVTDEGVQIHGGYGYHQDYTVERAYRDSRINRIFEGTNEINRLLATGMLLKRAQRGQLALVDAVKRFQAELLGSPTPAGMSSHDGEQALVENAKRIGLLVIGVAYQRFLNSLEEQQEILAAVADILIQVLAMELVVLRAQKLGAKAGLAASIAAVFARSAMESIEQSARTVLGASSEGDGLRTNLAVLRRYAKFDPVNSVELRRSIARRLLHVERYTAT
ncbi:MAG TPA: acyl-CoA dehydrogenase family protein [Bryobacteraceae bacterium]|nr:acyl-CoA dehydrogenase family protein [Bryobacteraceae bacterium]